MQTSAKLQYTVLVMALSAVYPLQATAASAGIAQFTAGDVNLRRPDGRSDPLTKGKDIESGQSIVTGANGRAQVKFSDGGLLSLQPNTEFKISNYVDKGDPKEDHFLVNLVSGSMRALTGLIGKRNHDNYKVTTSTATIGIRGSGFSAGYNPDGSLGVMTELDGIEVCNAAGCIGLTAGESVVVRNNNDAPVRTNIRPPVPTPVPAQSPVVVGNQTTNDGSSALITERPNTDTEPPKVVDTTPPPPDNPPPVVVNNTGMFTNLQGAAIYQTSANSTIGVTGPLTISAADAVNGTINEFISSGNDYKSVTIASSGSDGSFDAGTFIGWGTWTAGTRTPTAANFSPLHYVIGSPATAMPMTGTATYSLLGGTAVTNYGGGSGTLLNTSALSVNFGTGLMNADIYTSFGSILDVVSFTPGATQFSTSRVAGFFSGPGAARAGITYNSGTFGFYGAAAFSKN